MNRPAVIIRTGGTAWRIACPATPQPRFTRTGWRFGHQRQRWADVPAALVIGGLWIITLGLAAELIITGTPL